MIISAVSLTLVCKDKILVSRTFSTRHFYCLRFSLFRFRLNSSIRNKTGTHVFWENGVDYPRVFPGVHPLAKKPEDSGYEIELVAKFYKFAIYKSDKNNLIFIDTFIKKI